jgi:hypothetical protein
MATESSEPPRPGREGPAIVALCVALLVSSGIVLLSPGSFYARMVAFLIPVLPAAWAVQSLAAARTAQGGGGLARLLSRPAGAALAVPVLLAPVWMSLPTWVRHATTPSFDEFVKLRRGSWEFPATGAEVAASHSAEVWEGRKPVVFTLDYPGDRKLAYRLIGTVRHGGEILLHLEVEFSMEVRRDPGDAAMIRVDMSRIERDSRFRCKGRVQVDLDVPPGSEGAWRVPFRIDVGLLAGEGPDEFRVEQVKDLPIDAPRNGSGRRSPAGCPRAAEGLCTQSAPSAPRFFRPAESSGTNRERSSAIGSARTACRRDRGSRRIRTSTISSSHCGP